ncbi:regucalcin-like [Periplaneta americana]|uniref:regucalcin-like n=1 Tax=Periplaneta americana TaxID=6978 RepID=UPI0037E82734
MSAPKVTQIGGPVTVGEGPHWDHESQALYYVDIPGSTVNKYVPATNKHTTVKIEGGPVSFVIPLEGAKDKFVISVGRNVSIMTWDGESDTPADVKHVCTIDTDKESLNNRLNDGKADPTGRLWAGTMGPDIGSASEFPPEVGSLYSFSKDWNATKHLTKITISNGLAWTEDQKLMYYIDSPTRKIYVFDFDAKNGKISNKRTAFDYEVNGVEGLPDGMTIDTEGKLWVACFNGSKVIRVDPLTGKLLSEVEIPSTQVTSVTIGGPQLDELYVTSANVLLSEEHLKKYPLSGATFRVTGVGVKGYPGQNVKL